MHANKIFPKSNHQERFWVRDNRHRCDDTDQPRMFGRVNIGKNRQLESTTWPDLQVDGYKALILDRIQHLIRPELSLGSSTISKHILPGVFMGFDQILGSPARIEYDQNPRSSGGF